MICFVAFIVLGVLSIFSVRYRSLFKESFLCVVRRVSFKPCETDFSHKIKFGIVGWLLNKNEKAARFFHKYMEAFSWLFMILFFASLIYTSIGVYNYIKHGTCNPNNPQNCILAPKTSPNETPRCLNGTN